MGEIIADLRIHEGQCLCHELPCAFWRSAYAVTAFRHMVLDRRIVIGGYFAIDAN
jgi:hypothetical protein